jgi:hypothetical protein
MDEAAFDRLMQGGMMSGSRCLLEPVHLIQDI